MESPLTTKTTLKSSSIEDPAKTRHCAFCLKESPGMKTCSGCKKRAYCSVSCQKKDWLPSGPGQGHKNWCKVSCCEEDVDWRVQEVPGKGLGLVALKDIPALARVVVDRVFTFDECQNDQRLDDLCPKFGSPIEKFFLNASNYFSEKQIVGFRTSRINHSCNPNVWQWSVSGVDNVVMFSLRSIKAGEEICSSYRSFQENLNVEKSPPEIFLRGISKLLRTKWDIYCDYGCDCKDPAILPLLKEMPRLTKSFATSGKKGDFNACLADLKVMLELSNSHPRLRGEMTLKIGILLFAFHAALGLENRMAEALLFLKEINEIFSRIEFPESEKSRLYKRIVNDPWAYDQATIMEKFQSLYDQLKTGTGTEYWLN